MKAGWDVNFTEYFEAIEQAGSNVNTVSREALAEVGAALESAMRAACPSDKLRPYIQTYTPTREGDFNYVAVGYVRDLSYTPAEIAVAANSVEFGSVNNAPMPHIRPVVRRMRKSVNEHIANRLKAAGLVDS